ncbi:MAG TPA: ATP-binding cassette domain-containing protein [Thermotogota bacterium]|nr:ATP-binding cassette domain-containing protein [Thermotogota bacterium]HRW93071.1 ATP-binding cassette domain-containing protein [Thermotogota bacterium]
MAIVEVKQLTRKFKVLRGALGKNASITAVNNVSFSIEKGETLGLVGESGCGKSTTGKMLLNLLAPTSGEIVFEGQSISGLSESKFKPFRRNIQIVFQDPYSSLNPRMTIFDLLRRPLKIFKITSSKQEEQELIQSTLSQVGLKPEHTTRYPHEFSGGQRQRVAVARAILTSPRFVVLDEPTSALDVSVQAQIMNLLLDLKTRLGLTYLFISHDLSVIKFISNRIAVMYLGYIVEVAKTREMFANKLHPYTRLLFQSIPVPNPSIKMEYKIDTGELPSLLRPPKGCPFATRCPRKMPRCEQQKPVLKDVGDGHLVSCFLYE